MIVSHPNLPVFWYNGLVTDQPSGVLDLRDRGVLLGDGVFDTASVIDGVMIDADAHIQRLLEHAAEIGLMIDADFVMPAIKALVPGRTGLLRLTVTRGIGMRGLAPPEPADPVLFAQLSAWDVSACFAPVRLWKTPICRNETSPLSRIKSLNYLDAVLAHRDALAAGADEALFINHVGNICCTGTGNIFVITSEGIFTPPLSDGVMNGTIRAWLLAQESAVHERHITPDILTNAGRAFITNSRRLLAPVSQLDLDGRIHIFDGTVPDMLKSAVIAHIQAQTSRTKLFSPQNSPP